ncbi:MAG: DUF362 domain-containing protein [Candidatus Abyssobacteria bacterium SURF_17]|uniref:DUF362 domain-containing protein n=1 Tax=Candidatus Abyssobacteria bacterium SURF_17 TaxID=2093361 RepID=A0A419F9D5_9BACT|nr:MAG: DUF362 domain-containing protein [Candidatus Abyssubacteria bacterium SURF_17]
MEKAKHTRRRFLKYFPALPAGLWTLSRARRSAAEPLSLTSAATSRPSTVAVATSSELVKGNATEPTPEIARILNEAIAAVTGKADARSAWKGLFSPADVIGIKVNCLAGPGLSSHPEVVAAIVESLADAGFTKERIIVWDRTERELASVGFTEQSVNGARILATDSPGIGYENDIEFSGEVGSCFSRILTRVCTALINVPVLKDHDLAGVSLGMKNFYGAIHNPNKYHDNNCDPYVADVCAHPLIARKLRLVVCDALIGQYHGGPAPRPQWSWQAGSLIVSRDPVAVDRIGLAIIEEKRKEAGMQSLKDVGREPKYIQTAAQRGLGTADIGKISKVSIS